MKYKLPLLLILTNCLTMSCEKKEEWITMNDSYYLSESEISQLEIQVNSGDAKAAIRLSKYFGFYMQDREKLKFWMRKAAELGDPMSQYNMGIILIGNDYETICEEAIYWLKKAKAAGVESAGETLDYLEKESPKESNEKH